MTSWTANASIIASPLDAVRKGREARLRSLRDLDAAALILSKACVLVLDGAVNDGDLRAVVFAVVPQTALEVRGCRSFSVAARIPALLRAAGSS